MNSFLIILSILIFVLSRKTSLAIKRGPHHPRSEQSKVRQVDQHLTPEEHHMDDDLRELGIEAKVDDMSEEELTFYYFKIHDNDNNDALDGLEMLQAALHQDQSFKKIDRDNYLRNTTDELNHIIEVIDEFLLLADANKDGLLHYPEYVKAIAGSNGDN